MMGEETSVLWHSMSEDKIFSDHKETLLPVKVQVCFLVILENFVWFLKVIFAKDWEIIHETLHDALDLVRESRHLTPLK